MTLTPYRCPSTHQERSTNEHFQKVFAAGAAATGYAVRPPDGGDPRRRPHPLASFVQTIRLTGTLAEVPRREFVYCSGWENRMPFAGLRTRLLAARRPARLAIARHVGVEMHQP
ncbi:hypothetical protein [Sphaerisporangium flaviroseum]